MMSLYLTIPTRLNGNKTGHVQLDILPNLKKNYASVPVAPVTFSMSACHPLYGMQLSSLTGQSNRGSGQNKTFNQFEA